MRLIDADKLTPSGFFVVDGNNPKNSLDELINRISNAPTVDAVEVVHGRWTYTEGEYEVYMICSECGWESDFRTNYCPHCGAKMDLEE